MNCESDYEIKILNENINVFDLDDSILLKTKVITSYLKNGGVDLDDINMQIKCIKEKFEMSAVKRSRLKSYINAYVNSKGTAGIIQPIGKQVFLDIFLKKYPAPYYLGFPIIDWDVDTLEWFINTKYKCKITHDTFRKALACIPYNSEKDYQKYIIQKLEDALTQKRKIYYFHIVEPSFSNKRKKDEMCITNLMSEDSICYCGYFVELKKDFIEFKGRKSIYTATYNCNKKVFDLEYLLHKVEPSSIILFDNLYSNNTLFYLMLKDYFNGCAKGCFDYMDNYEFYSILDIEVDEEILCNTSFYTAFNNILINNLLYDNAISRNGSSIQKKFLRMILDGVSWASYDSSKYESKRRLGNNHHN